ncbi:DUF1549 and DUF1553 domain-containing protein [Verrucomicrobia bacterium]|nr:DUF1549 and DUF1553 domain-containing protein [Verrucomicrobiota bacterium]
MSVQRFSVILERRLGSAFWLLVLVFLTLPATAEIHSPASERFTDVRGAEVPDFQRHVVPLIGRLGCNGRSCHGSFQGQGGFQLSLFGYDFVADHAALTSQVGDSARERVDRVEPSSSLILEKPLELVDHEGGQRFDEDSWEHHLLLGWIGGGAAKELKERTLLRLEVVPNSLLFRSSDETKALQVVAVWADGYREDVTCLSRFRVNDDAVAKVSKDGVVRAGSSGDTHVVVFYDNGVKAIPVLRPYSVDAVTSIEADTEIDRAVASKLKRLGLRPSELCSDAEFLRRLSIDLTGTLPSPREVEVFLKDPHVGKRPLKIEELLERPAYAAWWTNKLCDYMGNNPNQQADVGQALAVQWYRWVYARVKENLPYDELVAKIVLATGRSEGTDYVEYTREMSSYLREDGPADFANRDTMPHYWSRRTLKTADDKALAFAHSFLGLRLQCAQCHKHPFDQWSKSDFKEFTRFFDRVKYGVAPDGLSAHQAMAKANSATMKGGVMMQLGMDMLGKAEGGQTVPWREVYVKASLDQFVSVNLLGQQSVQLTGEQDPRETLMNWMRRPNNPYFATAFVNRVWANYFGKGIIDPPDDLNQANPPSNSSLLDSLASGFVASGFDMKWLHREIVSSETYQRSWRPNETNGEDRRNFSRMLPRRLPAEVIYDALTQVTASDSDLVTVRENLERRAIGHLSMRMAGTYAMNVFGKPARATNCDCERSDATSLLQTLFLKNDLILRNRLRKSGWLREVEARFPGPAPPLVDQQALVSEAYLRCVGRLPDPFETERATNSLASAKTVRAGMEDLVWALLNTKEFVMNH